MPLSGSHPTRPSAASANAAGFLLILGVLTSLAASGLVGPSADAHASMPRLAADKAAVLASVLLQFATAAGAVGIAIALYPAVRRQSAALAIGAVGFRAVEATFACLAALSLAGLLAISETAGHDQVLWSVLATSRNAANYVFAVLFYGLGAAHYLVGLHRGRLLPQWLTVWGMVGAAVVSIGAVIDLLGGPPFAFRGDLVLAAVPIAAQEIVLGFWLLRFGFREPADPTPRIAPTRIGAHGCA
jgi:hypothetical protein